MATDLHQFTARKLASLIRKRELDPVELVSHYITRIEEQNPDLNALRVYDKERALILARERSSEATKGEIRGRLHGLVFSAKDHIDVAGLPASEGTKVGAIDCSPASSRAVELLEAEGAICIGKGNMAQYGKSFFTENSDYGRTHSPFGKDLSPGGSGGGDAAALAAGFTSFGLGTDTGGSLRIPAAFCGLHGLFPTPGTISETGLTIYSHTTRQLLRSLGPLARSADDLAMLYSVISGYDPRFPYSIQKPATLRDSEPKTKRIGWFSSLNGVECDPEIKSSLEQTCSDLQAVGFETVEFKPEIFEQCFEVFIILGAQVTLAVEDHVRSLSGVPYDFSLESDALKHLRKRIQTELPELDLANLFTAWHALSALRKESVKLFDQFDFVLGPVAATLPIPYGTSLYKVGEQELESQEVFQFSSPANVLGLPAASFPVSTTADGLPVALQLVGPRFSEYGLLSTAFQITA